MKVRVLKGKGSLRNSLNKGMSFNEWRHLNTNYDQVSSCLSNSEFKELVRKWGPELVHSITNIHHQVAVIEWIKSHLET